MTNKHLIHSITGAAIAAVSTAIIADYAMRKAKEKTAYTALLITGILGVAAGTLLAGCAVKQAKQEKYVPNFNEELDDCEVEAIEASMSEILCDTTPIV